MACKEIKYNAGKSAYEKGWNALREQYDHGTERSDEHGNIFSRREND